MVLPDSSAGAMSHTRTLRVELKVLDRALVVEDHVPIGQVRPDELLPFMYHADNVVIGAAIAKSEAEGKHISCAKGCSACCRAQPVPVTPAEAHAIARLVDAMPEPRRAEVQARFDDRVARLKAAGLFDVMIRDTPVRDKEQARAVAREYVALGLVCPFLDDDACSIHPHRPFVCRQYLVTSPPELCSNPLANPVEVVPIPVKAATAMLSAAEPVAGRPQLTVPLVVALEYNARHRSELERTGDTELILRRWLAELA
jgi:Fe-S-cluster containining protein